MADDEELLKSKQVSIHGSITNIWEKESFHDVTLKGSDGLTVGASRHVLAARSEVFEKMLLSDFKEASENVIEIGFDGEILKSVAEFIYTDKASMLDRLFKEEADDDAEHELANISLALKLMEAAAYFELPGLYRLVSAATKKFLDAWPGRSFLVLEACSKQGPSAPSGVKAHALAIVRSNKACVEKATAVALLSPPTLEEILRDKDTLMEEYYFFQILDIWVNSESLEDDADAGLRSNCRDDRRSIAAQMIKHINLESIDPKHLSTTVTSSGYVTSEQLLEAFKSQALSLAAQTTGVVVFKKRRLALPVWNTSSTELYSNGGSNIQSFLEYPPMRSGIHQWTVELEAKSNGDWIGVVSSRLKDFMGNNEKCVHYEKGSWLVCASGATFQDGSKGDISPVDFNAIGSKVTFTLDLSNEDEGKGTLSASVDGKARHTLFTGLKAHLHGSTEGFLPVLSGNRGCEMRLLSITIL